MASFWISGRRRYAGHITDAPHTRRGWSSSNELENTAINPWSCVKWGSPRVRRPVTRAQVLFRTKASGGMMDRRAKASGRHRMSNDLHHTLVSFCIRTKACWSMIQYEEIAVDGDPVTRQQMADRAEQRRCRRSERTTYCRSTSYMV